MWEGQGRVQGSEPQELRCTPLLRPTRGMSKARLVSANQKEWSFGKLQGIHLRGTQGKQLEGRGDYHKGLWGNHTRNLHLVMTLWVVFRAGISRGGHCQFKSLATQNRC